MERSHGRYLAHFMIITMVTTNLQQIHSVIAIFFYVNESIQLCLISGETLSVKSDFNHARTRD